MDADGPWLPGNCSFPKPGARQHDVGYGGPELWNNDRHREGPRDYGYKTLGWVAWVVEGLALLQQPDAQPGQDGFAKGRGTQAEPAQ